MSETTDETMVEEGKAVTDGEPFNPIDFLNKHVAAMYPDLVKHNQGLFIVLVGAPQGEREDMTFTHASTIQQAAVPALLRFQADQIEAVNRPRAATADAVAEAVERAATDTQDDPPAAL